MKRKKRKRGKCKRCSKRTTHTEQVILSNSIDDDDYKLVFFCVKCTRETPEG